MRRLSYQYLIECVVCIRLMIFQQINSIQTNSERLTGFLFHVRKTLEGAYFERLLKCCAFSEDINYLILAFCPPHLVTGEVLFPHCRGV